MAVLGRTSHNEKGYIDRGRRVTVSLLCLLTKVCFPKSNALV
jgi:hypothetical protein